MMNSRWKSIILALVPMIVVPVVIAGCDGKAAPMTSEEKSQFAGGPMPESARNEMQKRLQQSKVNSEQNRKSEPAPGG
jgi:hypothetical protein